MRPEPHLGKSRPGHSCLVAVTYQNGQRLYFELDRAVGYLGRGPSNDICLPHAFLSTRHLRLRLLDGAFGITDLGSIEGTRVGDQLLEPNVERQVREGEEVLVGPLTITLESVLEATLIDGEDEAEQAAQASTTDAEGETPMPELDPELWSSDQELEEELRRAAEVAEQDAEVQPNFVNLPTPSFGGQLGSSRMLAPPQPPLDLPWVQLVKTAGGLLVLTALAMLVAVLMV